jgi:hypothetical protein
MRAHLLAAAAAAIVFSCAGTAQAKKAALDQTLYSMYSPDGPPGTGLDLTVCGAVGNTMGCYGGGFLEPFEHECAILEGAAKTKENIVTRSIYVLDERSSKNDPAILYVYTRTDAFSENGDSINVSLNKQVTLDLHGGSKAKCFMAASDTTIYAGTSVSGKVSIIDKKSLAATTGADGGLVTAITADDRGNVAIDSESGFGVIPYWNPSAGIGGGGVNYLSNTRNALTQ